MPGQPISHYFKEVARDMVVNPNAYQVFGNAEGKLPKAKTKNGEYYIEAHVPFGQASGMGQFRVVCLCREDKAKTVLVKKYYSKTHYGTGEDAGKKPDFVEFQ
jgi:hypothetical protein